MKLFVIFAIIGIAACGALPASIKTPILAGSDAMVDLAMNCLKTEAKSKAAAFVPKPLSVAQFIDKIEKETTPQVKSAVKTLLSPLRRRMMGFSMPALPSVPGLGSLTGLAGTALKTAAKPLVCVPLVEAIKAAAMAVGILYLPACVTAPVKAKCEAIIDSSIRRRLGALPASIKTPILAGSDAMVDLAMNCLKSEAKSKAAAFVPKPLSVAQFIDKIEKETTPQVKSAVKTLLTPLRRRMMGFTMPALPTVPGLGSLTGLAGAALKTAAKPLVCVPLVEAIKAAAMAVGILYLPACVTAPVKAKCEAIIDGAIRRRQILRRLAALKREIQNF